jgi:phage terminase large subunit-like protein
VVKNKNKTFRNRIFLDCNPSAKSHWAYWLFVKKYDPIDKVPKKNPENYAHITLNPADNPHLSAAYLSRLDNQSSRNKMRFKEGKWLDDIEGALWKQFLIDRNRVAANDVQDFDRVILGVDPAVSADKKSSDETGIVVVGLKNKKGYVIADASGIYTPDGWGQKVVDLYNYYNVAMIVCETNNGGDLVVSNMTHIDRRLRIKKIHAKKGKVLRADPVVGMYERDEIKHLGSFKDLEEQMTTWVPENSDSPDRIDALVYAFHELMAPKTMPSIKRV